MIDNIIMLLSGTIHGRSPDDVLERCHPLGYFDTLATVAVAQSTQELYELVLFDSPLAVYFEKMEELSSWMDHYGLEPALKRRVRRFFKQFYADHSAIDDQYILERLSPVLQEATAGTCTDRAEACSRHR